MATLVDLESTQEDNLDELVPSEEEQQADQLSADNPEEVAEAEAQEIIEDLPEKYQGKTAAELAKMHANLEELLGRQSKEVGELRQAFDRMVQESITSKQHSAPEPVPEDEDIDFWADPEKAIAKTIANHPKLKQAEELSDKMAKTQAQEALKATHPDMKDILVNAQFHEWVKASPIRTKLFAQADHHYDYDAANELFSLWKERQGVAAKQQVVEEQARKQEVKKASTGSTRSNAEGAPRKKVYRRRDIIDLQNRDPKRYEAMQDEIMRAYAEGRVK